VGVGSAEDKSLLFDDRAERLGVAGRPAKSRCRPPHVLGEWKALPANLRRSAFRSSIAQPTDASCAETAGTS
jgi:hypothetical protein